MTISYTTASKSGSFLRLLFKWRGSIWKSIWRKLLLFSIAYGILSVISRIVLDEDQLVVFQRVVNYFDESTKRIPLTFILGFYVSLMVTRWWAQFEFITFPDRFMIFVSAVVTNADNPDDLQLRKIRRTLARYVNLSSALVYRNISIKVMKRFPTHEHLVKGGLMTKEELEEFKTIPSPFGNYFIPLVWSANIVSKCWKQGIIDGKQLDRLLDEINSMRSQLGTILTYDWIPVPLIYTQVATLATYGYFIFCIVGRQYTPVWSETNADLYVPIFTILEFIFYIGWLQVGEELFNPFGEDDEDFEMNYIMDRNLTNGYLIGDGLHGKIGALTEDIYWNNTLPRMPHTVASRLVKEHYFGGHLSNFQLKDKYKNILDPNENNTKPPSKQENRHIALLRNRVMHGVDSFWQPHLVKRHSVATYNPTDETAVANVLSHNDPCSTAEERQPLTAVVISAAEEDSMIKQFDHNGDIA